MDNLTPAQKELYDWLVDYIRTTQHAPSIRQMMRAMNLKSPAPIQSRLERLHNKGYVEWTKGKARTIRILRQEPQGLPILGEIAAGGLVEPFTDVRDKLDLSEVFGKRDYFALKVVGDSMIEDHITEGDLAIMRSLNPSEQLKNGEIVAARVEGHGTTLKRFYCNDDRITLKAANPKYLPIEVMADTVEVQGILIGVWRGYQSA
jgi:repressor LexA